MPLPPDPVLPAGDEALEARITELAAHMVRRGHSEFVSH
jgi:hypothetical protein